MEGSSETKSEIVRSGVNEKTLFPQQRGRVAGFIARNKKKVIAMGVVLLLLPLLGLIALRNHHARADYSSPGVFPSPQGYGAGNWSDAYQKANAMVSKMTLEEMNNITIGYQTTTGCVGMSGSAPNVGFPGFCLHDAGNGVRDTDGVNAYASGVHVGASWNASLAYDRAVFMGAEFKKKGVNVALGPVVGPIGRVAEGGRNWEGFAADPYLDGILGAQSIRGLQQNVIASIKHFVGYEQETNRNPISDGDEHVMSVSSNIDDRTMHELYLWPFQDAVHAGVGCVMCSYNRINNTYACENSKTMNGILKGELNFQGFVVSDWAGQHSGLPSAQSGLDMAMPTSQYWDDDALAKAVNDGSLNKTRLVDMATRIVATWYYSGQDGPDYPEIGVGLPIDLLKSHKYVDAKDPASKGSLLDQAIQGHVLVKNDNGALPLKKPSRLSVFGYDAVAQLTFNPGQNDFTQNWEALGLQQPQTAEIASNKPVLNAPQISMGTLIVGGGSASNTPAYISTPYDALQIQAYNDDTSMFFDFSSDEPSVAAGSDACLVFINEYSSETWDRPGLADENSDNLVESVARQCNNTIVVIHNAGIRLVDKWIDNSNVTAVIFAHLPGQDAGRSIVQLLYGQASPSGRLPYTVAKKPSDYGALQSPCNSGGNSPQCAFDEGVNIDYRSFLARGIEPRFAFGYGLTYSSFDYSALQIAVNATSTAGARSTAGVYANGTTDQNAHSNDVGLGGLLSLFESMGSISATVTNNGSLAAAEVAQLYLQIPAPPPQSSNSNTPNTTPNTRTLRGFQKIALNPGEGSEVVFPLRRKDLSYWDSGNQTWITPSGVFQVFVGRSVLDVPLQGTFSLY
ncbi:glycoside hydrolase family 3 [Lecanosticta acicola]|uniref:beta-glucosidase n=1 Tax=Lecanosticta acicola TaxID=111012 RepID=A0AAI9E4Z4_9PEZI|nr:glycoside hydrolase family 3 [Lecanosticta acicola]